MYKYQQLQVCMHAINHWYDQSRELCIYRQHIQRNPTPHPPTHKVGMHKDSMQHFTSPISYVEPKIK